MIDEHLPQYFSATVSIDEMIDQVRVAEAMKEELAKSSSGGSDISKRLDKTRLEGAMKERMFRSIQMEFGNEFQITETLNIRGLVRKLEKVTEDLCDDKDTRYKAAADCVSEIFEKQSQNFISAMQADKRQILVRMLGCENDISQELERVEKDIKESSPWISDYEMKEQIDMLNNSVVSLDKNIAQSTQETSGYDVSEVAPDTLDDLSMFGSIKFAILLKEILWYNKD